MAIDPKSVKEIFLEAAELSDEAARAAYLDRACGADAGVRERVDALLRSHDPECSFLGTPAAVVPDPAHDTTQPLTGNLDPGVSASQTARGANNDAAIDELLRRLGPPTRSGSLGRLGHYEVLQVLGRGGFGIVFRAFDEMLQRVVALKVMAPLLAATSPARKRFLREARSSAQVRHENVVRVYEVADQPLPYLAMEFIPGETLQQKLDRVGPLDVPEVLRVGRQIAEGLAAAHAMDLIHRDIKPANVLLEGSQQKVKITDFGLARTADDASISQSGIIAGTPMYMAPEQAKGETLDQRADLFSLGSVLYQMVAGRPPFRATRTLAVLKRVSEDTPRPIREIIPETPQWLCDIISKLHAKNPDDRYQSAREVADVLADCEAQLKADAKLPVTLIGRLQSGRLVNGPWLASSLLVVVALLGLVGAGWWVLGVIRSPTKEDDLVFEVEPEDSPFVFSFGKGGAITLEDRERKKSYSVKAVPAGADRYELEIVDPDADLAIKTPKVSVKRGGKVVVNAWFERKAGPVSDGPKDSLEQTVLKLEGEKVGDADVAAYKGCTNLTTLSLRNTKVSDDGLANFAGCEGLRVLDLYGSEKVGEKGLANFRRCKNLQVLALGKTGVSDAALVFFRDCDSLTDLSLDNCPQVGDEGIANLKPGKKLGPLGLAGTGVTNKGLALFSNCKELWYVNLGGAQEVSDLSPLKGMRLTALYLKDTKVEDLSPLKGMFLTTLRCDNTNVTDLSVLQGMPLKTLWCDFKPERDAAILRSIKTLKTINEVDAWKLLE